LSSGARRGGGRFGFWLFAFVALGAVAFFLYRRHTPAKAPPPPPPKPPAAPAPRTSIDDPLAPGRPAKLDPTRDAASGDWVTARPGFQYSRGASERGANPCALPAADTTAFTPWANLVKGRITAPKTGGFDASGGFELVLHFHGDELARRELALSGQSFVLYGLTLDPSENYAALFAGTKFLSQLVHEIEQTLTKTRGAPAHARKVGLSAWSAGYMAVLSIVAQPESKDVDTVILIDGLHGPRGHLELPLAPFVDFARQAEKGERLMIVTHSSIDPPDFASTTEAAHYLLSALGEKPEAVKRDDRYGLELVEYFSRGQFHVRGYAGNDKADHCAQVTLLRDAYAALGRRWQH
jgi:hypothetical protein